MTKKICRHVWTKPEPVCDYCGVYDAVCKKCDAAGLFDRKGKLKDIAD